MVQSYLCGNSWKPESSDSFASKLLLYLLWPFGAWLHCLKSVGTKSSYYIFFLFNLLLCWHMAPAGGAMYDDFLGVLERFNQSFYSISDICAQAKLYFTLDDLAPKDLYEQVVIWLVKSFTDNYHFFFLICSIPISICQLSCLRRITGDAKFLDGTWLGIIVVAMFIFPRDIITTQNPRFSTAFWLALTCVLNYFCSDKHSLLTLLPILLAPLIHSGMWLFVLITILFIILPKRIGILEFVAICSIPFSFLGQDVLSGLDLSNILPTFLYNWSLNHFDPENIATNVENRAGFWWLGQFFVIFRKLVFIYFLCLFINKKDVICKNDELCQLYPYFLFITIVINFLQPLPVLGGRYYWFIQILTVYIWFKAFYPTRSSDMKWLLIATSWGIFSRYGYIAGGALSCNTTLDMFFTPLPYLIGKGLFW